MMSGFNVGRARTLEAMQAASCRTINLGSETSRNRLEVLNRDHKGLGDGWVKV
jgi:hypothetical protein